VKKFWWQTEILKNCSGSNLLACLICWGISEHKNLIRMAATDFEFLLNRIAPPIFKQNKYLWESSDPRKTGSVAFEMVLGGVNAVKSVMLYFVFIGSAWFSL
jgi:hypothetical protein